MSILCECPICRRKQSAKSKSCNCGQDLDKAKQSRRVRYWINYRLPGGKQRREPVGYSVEEARDADGKRRSQKREGNIFDMLPQSKISFKELTDWYLDLPKVKQLSDYKGVKIRLNNFNAVHGEKIVKDIKPVDIENYQITRLNQEIKSTTVDLEITNIRTVVFKAFDNDMVGGRTMKAFRNVKKISTKNERSRNRVIAIDEYVKLLDKAAVHLKPIITIAYNTGMRPGELMGLKWSYIDLKKAFIHLPADFTKEKAERYIPINHYVKTALESLPRALKHDFVFMYRGNPIRAKGGPPEAFQTACKESGIIYGRDKKNGAVMHDLRRSFKTNMLKAGIDKAYRDTLTGHSLRGMDVHYIKPSKADLTEAMSNFTKWLDLKLQIVDHTVDQKKATA